MSVVSAPQGMQKKMQCVSSECILQSVTFMYVFYILLFSGTHLMKIAQQLGPIHTTDFPVLCSVHVLPAQGFTGVACIPIPAFS